jgi:hypothetical protein
MFGARGGLRFRIRYRFINLNISPFKLALNDLAPEIDA